MDVIEFLQNTDHRNLKNQISFMVKQRLRERDKEVEERRQRLKQILEEETQQYDLELLELSKAHSEQKEAERLDWIGLMRLERERAEEELLKIKKTQQQLENAEEIRHIYSREMLMDSKQAQLYQIEEKKFLREKQLEMDRFWLDAMKKYDQENEKLNIAENKLRKFVSDVDQERNLAKSAEIKLKAKEEVNALREEFNKDNIRACYVDTKQKKDEDFYKWRKKVHHRNVLERQILHNALNADMQRRNEKLAANVEFEQNQRAILTSLDQECAKTVKNYAQQKEYLKYVEHEKKLMREQEKKFECMLIGTGCVLEQKNKRPYGKNTR